MLAWVRKPVPTTVSRATVQQYHQTNTITSHKLTIACHPIKSCNIIKQSRKITDLAKILTSLLSQSESRRDNEPKKKTGLKEIWSRHHSYSGKLWKTIKIKQVCEKPDFGSGSRLRVRKVLAPYRVRPRTVPLIKNAKLMWFSKY